VPGFLVTLTTETGGGPPLLTGLGASLPRLTIEARPLGAIAAETRLTRRLIAAQGPVTEGAVPQGAVRTGGTFVATPVEPIAPPRSFVPSRPRITEGSLFAQRAILARRAPVLAKGALLAGRTLLTSRAVVT
jgi:hypothetical protein